MPNKKINELTPRTPTLTDLIIVGDPASGFSFKATLSAMVNFVGGNIQFSSLGGISLTNPTNGQVLTFNGTNWVNQTPASAVSSVFGRTGAVVATEGDYSLTQLSDVTLSSPTTNQVLQYNGTAWVNGTISVPVTSVFGRTGVVVATEGDYNLGQLGDVTISSPTSGQVLKYNGTAWVNDSDTDTGITSLNGLTATTQTFATGTSGTDFTISSTTSTHTFNIPTASSSNRGLLSSADWSTFNSKQSAITLTTTGSSGASTLVGATLNIPTYTLAGLGGVSGSGTTNYVSKWTGSTALGNSQIFDNGTSVGIGTTSLPAKLSIKNDGASSYSAVNFENANSNSTFQIGVAGNSVSFTDLRNNAYIWNNAATAISFGINTIERMRLSNGGNLLIGTTTDAGTGKLQIVGGDANINGLTVGKGGGNFSTNTAFGVSALAVNTTGGANNVAIGNNALALNTSAGENTALGSQAGNKITTGYRNTSIGYRSFNALTTGIENVSVGAYNAEDITTAKWNTIIGYNTGRGITTGDGNTIIGAQVSGLSSSLSNTIILADGQGNQRLVMNSTLATIGTDASINGLRVGKGTGNQTFSTAVGTEVMTATVTGNYNTAVGYRALRLVTSGADNTTLGYNTGAAITTGGYNTIIGSRSGSGITTSSENTLIGASIGVTTGNANTIVGSFAGNVLTSGGNNTYMGWYAGVNATTSALNTGIGYNALGNITTGANNTALGSRAGRFFGASTSGNTTGTQGIFIGYQSRASADGNTNETVIGYDVVGNGSNSVTLGNSSVTKTVFQSGVLVGTTTSAGYALDVNGTVRTSSFFQFAAGTRGILATDSYLSIFQTNASLSTIVANSVRSTASSSEVQKSTADPASYLRLNYQDGITFHTNLTGAVSTAYAETTNERMRITLGGSVGIGTATPNASALLDVSSTTKGFAPPRGTNAQMLAIVSPVAGLIFYDTTNNKLNVYDGTNWVATH
jgi:hypothetical protein